MAWKDHTQHSYTVCTGCNKITASIGATYCRAMPDQKRSTFEHRFMGLFLVVHDPRTPWLDKAQYFVTPV